MAVRQKARQTIRIGCAGWAIPQDLRDKVPPGSSHLVRYAQVLSAAEVNSSFYRYHEPSTYERWAMETPAGFRFSVKAPREITHFLRLKRARKPLYRFLEGTTRLGRKLGPILVQLPPSFSFNRRAVKAFLELLRDLHDGAVVCEPRHASWFVPDVAELLACFRVARVAADPACVEEASRPGGWTRLAYYRLHGSPQMYYSAYSGAFLRGLAKELGALPKSTEAWCIFDNTAAGAAMENALEVAKQLGA